MKTQTLDDVLKKETLVGQFKAIENLPDFARVDKHSTYRSILDYWLETSPLVRRMNASQTTPSAEVEKVAKRVGGLNAFLPIYIRAKTRESIKELVKVVGGYPHPSDDSIGQSNFVNLVGNPIGVSAAMTLAYFVLFNLVDYISNVKLIESEISINKLSIYGGILHGTMIGSLSSILKLYELHITRKNAKYVESKIQEVRRI